MMPAVEQSVADPAEPEAVNSEGDANEAIIDDLRAQAGIGGTESELPGNQPVPIGEKLSEMNIKEALHEPANWSNVDKAGEAAVDAMTNPYRVGLK